jgi:hypothetical protein
MYSGCSPRTGERKCGRSVASNSFLVGTSCTICYRGIFDSLTSSLWLGPGHRLFNPVLPEATLTTDHWRLGAGNWRLIMGFGYEENSYSTGQ